MKEVTVWNNKPRMMWCWDEDESRKLKKYVVHILSEEELEEGKAKFPVCAYGDYYQHCAEIEEKRPCTREELLEMLKKQGLTFLWKRTVNDTDYTVDIRSMDNTEVTMDNGECYKYEDLCKHYTLLDGTDLWIKE